MNHLKMQCLCCNCESELIRDHISGPNHFRCGNCFDLVDVKDIPRIEKINAELKILEEKRHAILATHGLNRS